MLNPTLKRMGLGLMYVLVSSLFFCIPPKDNTKQSLDTKISPNTIKQPIIHFDTERMVVLDSFSLEGLPLSFRVTQLVRTMGQPDIIIIPEDVCSRQGEIFRQYCYQGLTCMTYGDLEKVGAAPRVELGLVETIDFRKNNWKLNYRGLRLDQFTSMEELGEVFPQARRSSIRGREELRLRVNAKDFIQTVGFYFEAGELTHFVHHAPCQI